MSLRIRLALLSSIITLLALIGLSVVTGVFLQRSLFRDLDEELEVQARQILDEAKLEKPIQISVDLENTLVTATGSTTAFLYFQSKLQAGAGKFDAPSEPLDPIFFQNTQTVRHSDVNDWRIVSLRLGDFTVQVGRPLSIITRNMTRYVNVVLMVSLGATGLAGLLIAFVVAKTVQPLEKLAHRVKNLESGEVIPGVDLPDEIGILARVLEASLTQLQASRERQNRFVTDAAHELRTPVTALLADLETHRARQRKESENQAVLERFWRNAQHLRRLINNLLTLSQTERDLKLQPLDLTDLASDVTDRLMPLAASKSLELSIDGEPAKLLGDRLMLERVLDNILGNALKFTSAGEVRVLVGTQDQKVILSVTDTGIGMNDTDLELVFEAFHRGNSITEGSGLGLAVVKAVMEAHHGQVQIKSEPNVGTTVRLEFPALIKA
jgi:signal transduction histidine kinase